MRLAKPSRVLSIVVATHSQVTSHASLGASNSVEPNSRASLKMVSASTPPNAPSDLKNAHSVVMDVKGECSHSLRRSPLKLWKDVDSGSYVSSSKMAWLMPRGLVPSLFHAIRILLTCVLDHFRYLVALCRVKRSLSASYVA